MSKTIIPDIARVTRWLPKATRRARRRLQAWPGDVQLEPLKNIVQRGPTRFYAENGDPQFSLKLPHMPVGPVQLEIQVEAAPDYPFDLKLFYDTGVGFSAAQRVDLPPLAGGQLKSVLRLPSRVQALRLDVGSTSGEFGIARVRLREISGPEAWIAGRIQSVEQPSPVAARPPPPVASKRHFVLTTTSLFVPPAANGEQVTPASALVPAPESTGELTFSLDEFTFDAQTGQLKVRGWAFPVTRPSLRHTIQLVLVGANGAFAVPTRPMIRPDVWRAFDCSWLAYSGFYQATVLPALPPGQYRVGLLVECDEPSQDLRLLPPTTDAGFAVRTLQELDDELREMAKLGDRIADWVAHGQLFYWGEETTKLPADPLSDEYRMNQLALYESVSGRNGYNPWASEPFAIDVGAAADPYPFPYSTRDGEFVGNHMLALGHIMRVMKAEVPRAKSIIEYGCGTGFTTIVLAQTGFDVTAVDINADALSVVNRLAQTRGLPVKIHNGVFGEVPESTPTADVVLFYESFHHCWDFVDVLKRLHGLVSEHGAVILAGEPIVADFPKPWGLRLSGQALWEIRTKGWLELGFQERFFLDLLDKTGWNSTKHSQENAPDIYVLKRRV